MARKKKHTLSAQLGTVGINKQTARIGFKLNRTSIELADADTLLTGGQLQVELSCDPNARGDADGQQTFESAHLDMDGVAEVGSLSVSRDNIGGSLVFCESAIDVQVLAKFRNQAATIKCARIGDAEGKGGKGDEEEAE